MQLQSAEERIKGLSPWRDVEWQRKVANQERSQKNNDELAVVLKMEEANPLLSSFHDGHGTNVVMEDSAWTSGSSVEFSGPTTHEGLNQNAIAPQREQVPRSPEVVDVLVNCDNKTVRILGFFLNALLHLC